MPVQLGDLLDRLSGKFRRRDVDEDIGIGALDLHHLGIHRWRRGLVGGFDHDQLVRLVAQAFAQADDVVLAEVVVLIEHPDGLARMVLQDIGRVDPCFGLVVGLPTHGPGKVFRIVPLGGAGRDEDLRHLLRVHVFLDRGIAWRAQRIEDQQHLVGLDELARLLHRLRRAVAVVIGDEVDLAAVDAALGIELVEIGGLGLADRRIGRSRTRIGHDVADLDLGIGRAGIIFLLGVGRACERNRYKSCYCCGLDMVQEDMAMAQEWRCIIVLPDVQAAARAVLIMGSLE